jgi:hypothetical protein
MELVYTTARIQFTSRGYLTMALQRARFQQHQASSVLVTVQGPTRAIDLQLPTDTPVGELIPLLLPICVTQEENHPGDHEPVWVLGIEGQPPFGMHETLMSHDITDGTTLWLTDFNAPRLPIPVPEVTVEPPVADIPVKVTDGIRWKSLIPYMALFVLGVMAVYSLAQAAFRTTAPAFTLSGPAYMALPAILRSDSVAEQRQNPPLNSVTTANPTTPTQVGHSASSNKATPTPKSQAKPPAKPNAKQQAQQWVNAAVHAHSTKNDNLAISDYQKAIQVDPSNFHAWANLAECQYTLGQTTGALKTLDTAMHTFSGNDYWALWTLKQLLIY